MYSLEDKPSETKVRKFLKNLLFGAHFFCPECGSRKVLAYGERYRCRKCRIKFSLLSHTWLANTKIDLAKLWVVLWCWTAEIPVRQAERITGLSNKAVRKWYLDFREHLPQDEVVLEKIVQLDEAYFGGFQKTTLLMAKEKGARKLAYEVLNHEPARIDAISFVKKHLGEEVILCTDGSSIYDQIDSHSSVKHQVDIHKAWEYSKTSEIEGVFGNLRTFIRRMYHHVRMKNLEKIVGEFCYRFCHPEMFGNPWYYLQIALRLVPTG